MVLKNLFTGETDIENIYIQINRYYINIYFYIFIYINIYFIYLI